MASYRSDHHRLAGPFLPRSAAVALFAFGIWTLAVVRLHAAETTLKIFAITNEPAVDSIDGKAAVIDSVTIARFLNEWSAVGINLAENRAKANSNRDFASALLGQRTLLSILAEYRAAHNREPNYEVRFFGWDDYLDKLNQIYRSDSPPDIVQVPSTWCSSLAGESNVLAPLPATQIPILNQFAARTEVPCRPAGDGRLYGIPWLLDIRVLYFWRDVFGMLDRDLEQSNDRRGAFELALNNARRRIAADGKDAIPLFGLPTARDWELLHQTALLVWGEHGELLQSRRELLFFKSYEPAFVESALRGAMYVRNLARDGLIDLPRENRTVLENEFLQAKRASVLSGTWLSRSLQQQLGASFSHKVGIALPPFGDENNSTFIGGSFLAMTRTAPSRGTSAAAAKLISYLATGPAAAKYAASTGLLPADNILNAPGSHSSADHPEARSADSSRYLTFVGDASSARVIAAAIKGGRSYDPVPQWTRLEAPSHLSGLYLLWQDIAGDQSDWELASDLRGIAESWDASLRRFPRSAAWFASGFVTLIIAASGTAFGITRKKKAAPESIESTRIPFTLIIGRNKLRGTANNRAVAPLAGQAAELFGPLLQQCLLTRSPVSFSAAWALIRLWASKDLPARPKERLETIVVAIRNFFREFDEALGDSSICFDHGAYRFTLDDRVEVMLDTGGTQVSYVECVRRPYEEALLEMEKNRLDTAFAALRDVLKLEELLPWPDASILIAILKCGTLLGSSLVVADKRIVDAARSRLQNLYNIYSRAIDRFDHDIVQLTGVGNTAAEVVMAHWNEIKIDSAKIRSALQSESFDPTKNLPDIIQELSARSSHPGGNKNQISKKLWEHFNVDNAPTVFRIVNQSVTRLNANGSRGLQSELAARLVALNTNNYEQLLNGVFRPEFIKPDMVSVYEYLAEALQRRLVEEVRESLNDGQSHVMIRIVSLDVDYQNRTLAALRNYDSMGRFPRNLQDLVDILIQVKETAQSPRIS